MSSPKNINCSILQLNKEELKIKKPTRKKTNFISNKRANPYSNDLSPKRRASSIIKFRNRKSLSLSNNDIRIKGLKKADEHKKKEIKHITSKDLIQRKMIFKKNTLPKETLCSFKTMGYNEDEKKSNKIMDRIKIDLDKQKAENANLKKVENKIFDAINKLKNNYQNYSLINEEILEDTANNNAEENINNVSKNSITNINNITRNSLFNKSNKQENSINNLNCSINSYNNNSNIKMNSPKNKDKSIKYPQDSINNFLNLSNNNYVNKMSNIDKKDKIRNIKRVRQVYDSFDDDESEKDDDDFHGNIISSKSSIILFFDLFTFLTSIYCLFYIPLRMAKFDCFCSDESKIHISLLYFIDLLFICDLCLSFFRGYYNFQFKLIKNNKKIFFHYLKTDFFLDFLEAIPFYTYSNFICSKNIKVKYCFNNDMAYSLIILKILTSLKIFKIFKVKNKQKNVTLNCFFNLFSENYSLEKSIDNFISFVFCFLAFHFFVCLNIFISKHTYPNWINNMQLQDMSLIYIYIGSSYSLIETLTTVGYGDAVCLCQAERIFQIIILGVGVIAYSYLISAFGNLIKNESESSIKYNNSLKILEGIRVDYPNMTFKLYNKIYNNIESRNLSQKQLDVNLLINSLPFNLKNALLLIMYNSIIKNFKFFKKCDNTNFIIQVLSKFVPSTNKKLEFLLFEGEMIEEIVFVKDGRLSLEAAIDMEDQENSIKKYFNINFKGITSAKEMKKFGEMKYSSKTIYSRKPNNFDNAKFVLKNAVKKQVNFLLNEGCEEPSILDKTKNEQNQYNNVKSNYKYGTDILKQEPIKNEEGNYKYIKVLDIRKNEYFGGLYIFLRRPSPLSLKVRSKFAELYLLPKKDVFAIAKSFSNIWRKIQKKDFHNMISIKHKTFKILNKYIEINGIEKVNPVDISRQNFLDETRRFISDKNVIFNNIQPRVYSSTSNNKQNLMKSNKEKSKFSNSSKSLKPFNPTKNYKISNKLMPNDMYKTQILTNGKLLADLNKIKNSNNNFSNKNISNNNISNITKSNNNINNITKSNKNISKNNINIIKSNNNIIINNNIKSNKNIINNNMKSSKDTNSNNVKSNKKISTNYKSNKNNNIHDDNDIDSNKDNGRENNIREDSEKINLEDKDNSLPHETEQTPAGKFTKNKILEMKEEKENYKKKEKKKKNFLFGKKTAELFKNKNFTIIFSGNEINNCIKINNINHLSSKTLNEENEENKINNYINMCQNISFFDKISEISSKDEVSINRFEKKNLVQEGVISFSFNSIYENINSYTNMKYSQNKIYQEKTLSFLNKLINKDSPFRKINSSFLSNTCSNIKANEESKFIKKDTLSLSGSSSSFGNYEELLNLKEKKVLNISTEKSGLKSANIELHNNNNEILHHSKNAKKKKIHKKNNKLSLNINMNHVNQRKSNKSNNVGEGQLFTQINTSASKNEKGSKRHTVFFNSINNIKLEENSGFDSGKIISNVHSKKKNKNDKIISNIDSKKKNKGKRHSQIYRTKKLDNFIGDINNENIVKDKHSKRRSKVSHKNSMEKVSQNKNISHKPSKSIKDQIIHIDSKKFIRESIRNSLDYFAKEEKDDECIII